jgi:HlyD family secretion protein
MAEPSRNRSRVWITLVVLLILAALVYYILPSNRDRVGVRTARVDRQALISTISTNGRVEPLVDFQAHAPMASVIAGLPIKLGQTVVKGQELVRLDASDARSKVVAAQAQLTGAQNSLRNMEAGGTQDELLGERSDLKAAQAQQAADARSLASLQALLAQGAASSNEVTAAQARVNQDQAHVAQLQTRLRARYGVTDISTQRAQVAEARSALTAAQSGLSNFDVHSPITGTVYSLPYALYDFVPAGDPLVNVADLHKLQVRAYFDEPEIGKLAAGEAVTINWDAKPNQTWHGHVTQAPTTIITYNGTRNVGVCLISIDDANGELIPNINVTVRVTTSEHFNVLSLPREALRTEGNNNYVYRVVGERLVRTPVTIHEGDVTLTRVGVSGGLNQGDLVALGATTDVDLTDGMRVKTQP